MYGYRIYYNDEEGRRYETENDEGYLDESTAYEIAQSKLRKEIEEEGYNKSYEINKEMEKYDIETYHIR